MNCGVTQFGRDALLDDRSLLGSGFTSAYSDELDAWIRSFPASNELGDGLALAAVGGYGRREMAPQSDLDVVLVHHPDVDPSAVADGFWYPIWDEGLKLGQRVDTVDGLLKLARNDLDTATSLLDIRHLAGDESLSIELAVAAREQWRAHPIANAVQLADRVRQLHHEHGEIAFTLGPDLKLGRGGLRDVHALAWVLATGAVAEIGDVDALQQSAEVLLRARVELHRIAGRPGDRLVLDYQDEIAARLGYTDADALMADVAAAGRSIAWACDAAWFWIERSAEPHRLPAAREEIGHGLIVDGWLLTLADDGQALDDPMTVLRLADAAAQRESFIDHDTLERLARGAENPIGPWTVEMRDRFVSLLGRGHAAIPVIEALDQVGLVSWLIPEWEPCRSKPQRNAYHLFTVDRHLLEAAAEASLLTGRVARPDLLLVGALLHDIGKGYPGDHTDVGVEIIGPIATRMGFDEADAATLVDLCRHHLLLPDVSTRRDLDDDGTIRVVADTVGSSGFLELLAALTEADSIATGPSAWSAAKAALVTRLVDRTRDVLEGHEPREVVESVFPSAHQIELMSRRTFTVDITDDRITVVQPDRPGAFFRVAGVLTLNGLDIVGAAAHTEDGIALSEFQVDGVPDVDRLRTQLEEGAFGRIALEARVDERRATYSRTRRRSSAQPIVPNVTFDNVSSESATVVEVSCRDDIGVLYRIARALTELSVTIWSARIQTIGDAVVDAFYVTHEGVKITDGDHQREIERAVLHAIGRH